MNQLDKQYQELLFDIIENYQSHPTIKAPLIN